MRSAESIPVGESAVSGDGASTGVVTNVRVIEPSNSPDAPIRHSARIICRIFEVLLPFALVSTVQEIQEAITQLPEEARVALLQWINSEDGVEDPELVKQAEEGARQLDAGQGISIDEARKLTSRWTTN